MFDVVWQSCTTSHKYARVAQRRAAGEFCTTSHKYARVAQRRAAGESCTTSHKYACVAHGRGILHDFAQIRTRCTAPRGRGNCMKYRTNTRNYAHCAVQRTRQGNLARHCTDAHTRQGKFARYHKKCTHCLPTAAEICKCRTHCRVSGSMLCNDKLFHYFLSDRRHGWFLLAIIYRGSMSHETARTVPGIKKQPARIASAGWYAPPTLAR